MIINNISLLFTMLLGTHLLNLDLCNPIIFDVELKNLASLQCYPRCIPHSVKAILKRCRVHLKHRQVH